MLVGNHLIISAGLSTDTNLGSPLPIDIGVGSKYPTSIFGFPLFKKIEMPKMYSLRHKIQTILVG